MAPVVSRRAIVKAVLVVAAMSAAARIAFAADNPPENLFGIPWRLTDLAGNEPIADHVPTLQFDKTGRAGGNTGCNIYFSTATISGTEISFSEIGTTYIACEEAVMNQERGFLEALELVAQFRLEEDGLELLDRDGAFLMKFVATS